MPITERFKQIRKEIPSNVTIVVAAKQRKPEEIREVIDAGATDIGENYVQEAEAARLGLGEKAGQVKWHMIGPLQTNKINKALAVFDVIQTVDSVDKAEAIDKRVVACGKDVIPVLIEVNIAGEQAKSGANPEEKAVEDIARTISRLKHLRLEGLMTMGPLSGNPENSRPYFKAAKEMFERLNGLHLPNTEMKTLSMGMSHSYKVAIDEGATMVRIGTIIFGKR